MRNSEQGAGILHAMIGTVQLDQSMCKTQHPDSGNRMSHKTLERKASRDDVPVQLPAIHVQLRLLSVGASLVLHVRKAARQVHHAVEGQLSALHGAGGSRMYQVISSIGHEVGMGHNVINSRGPTAGTQRGIPAVL